MPRGIYKRTKPSWIKGKTKKDYPQLSNTGVKKGNIPWNKGKKLGPNPEHSRKMKGRPSTMLGRKHKPESIEKMRKSAIGIHRGEKCGTWKGGITPINFKIRNSTEYRDWRIAVFEQDNYTCQECGSRGVTLNADHIKPFAYYPELRLAIENGRTLCVPCHRKTDTYKGRATKNYRTNAIANVKTFDTNA